jgi:hypothetical protein
MERQKMSKPFADFPERRDRTTDFNRPVFLRLREGTPVTIRVLDSHAEKVLKHWINSSKTSVLCLGEECPICQQNEVIRRENPKTFQKIKGYIPVQRRWMVNVLDRTPVIKDEETGEEYYSIKGKFPTVTSDGDRSLVNIQPVPSNTIKILERGQTLFELLAVIHADSIEEHGEEAGGITKFDVKLVPAGSGTDMIISAIPQGRNDDIAPILEQNNLMPYVLSAVGIELTPDEVINVVRGVSIRDIFAARRAKDESDTDKELKSSFSDLSDKVATLFGEDVG